RTKRTSLRSDDDRGRSARIRSCADCTGNRALLSVQMRLLQELVAVARAHADVRDPAVAADRERHLGARGAELPDRAEQVGERGDAPAADLEHEVARLDLRAVRGPARRD